jgi:NAD(P)-dependent dehydrogenase (short-subunit alcohol dehydrogenase family)
MRSALEAPRLMIAEGRHSLDVIVDEMGSRERYLHQYSRSSGYGKATAQIFLNERWNVVATMRRPQNDLFEGPGERLRVLPLDVTDDESIRRALDEAITAFGGIDVPVNNAGIGHSAVEPDDDEDIES